MLGQTNVINILFVFTTSPKSSFDLYNLKYGMVKDFFTFCLEIPLQTVHGICNYLVRHKGNAGWESALFRSCT